MCDCYYHKCEMCKEEIPMHIGDFDFNRDKFKVYCREHIKYAPTNSVQFEYEEESDDETNWMLRVMIKDKCAINGPEVGVINNGDNHPNVDRIIGEKKVGSNCGYILGKIIKFFSRHQL